MKYIIDVVKEMPTLANFSAWRKAPADVIHTLENIGAQPIFIIVPSSKIKILNILLGIFNTLKVALKIQLEDELYIQHYNRYLNFLVNIIKWKHITLNYIVHDLAFLRFGDNNGKREINFLSKMDNIFVHTELMSQILRSYNIKAKLKIMYLFDYYSNTPMLDEKQMLSLKNVIAFAGNLNKSLFLNQLACSNIQHNIRYRLYGLPLDYGFQENSQIEYMGAFNPSDTSKVQAGWGLLWDGDSIDTCSGWSGEYLKINSSHKLSLYLACGMPIILWEKSSLASWLSNQGVCILISSLKDISMSINEISEQNYMQMVRNARKLGNQLRQGLFLKNLI